MAQAMHASGPTVLAPTLAQLPGHWIMLTEDGLIACAHPELAARLGLDTDAPRRSFRSCLDPASRVLWETSLWPVLVRQGALSEALLDLRFAGAGAQVAEPASGTVLSHWQGCAAGGTARYVGLLMPGVERNRLVAELRHARDSLESMPGAVLQLRVGPKGELAFPYASGRLLDLLGVTPGRAAADPQVLLDAIAEDSRAALLQASREASDRDDESWQVVLTPLRDARVRLELAARRVGPARLWHGILTDVSERERLQEELRARSETDWLTRLPNRFALLAQLHRRIAAGEHFALLFMDCDRFKQINDSLGHDVGDELLRRLAQRLRHGLRPGDDVLAFEPMAARLGGDEFVIVADGVRSGDQAQAMASRLVSSMARPYQMAGLDLVATVSVGVVLSDEHSTPDQLLRDADTAMYEAKRRGRNKWVIFEREMHERVAAALELEGDLRRAVRAGRLRVAYQPIVDIASGRVTGLEALARWQHPERGEISPTQFIPVAEDCGLILEIGETVLRTACEHFADWRAHGVPLPDRLSVNLSRAQLGDPALPGRIAALLCEHGLAPETLQLEVTESMAMADETYSEALFALRALGVRLSLDDFGTGHSSLASLQQFPVQQVKIDRSFVRDIATSPFHRAIVQAALQVAGALDLEVVAEGVETAEQAELLAAMGCAKAQGWLYAHALEAPAVPDWLASH